MPLAVSHRDRAHRHRAPDVAAAAGHHEGRRPGAVGVAGRRQEPDQRIAGIGRVDARERECEAAAGRGVERVRVAERRPRVGGLAACGADHVLRRRGGKADGVDVRGARARRLGPGDHRGGPGEAERGDDDIGVVVGGHLRPRRVRRGARCSGGQQRKRCGHGRHARHSPHVSPPRRVPSETRLSLSRFRAEVVAAGDSARKATSTAGAASGSARATATAVWAAARARPRRVPAAARSRACGRRRTG